MDKKTKKGSPHKDPAKKPGSKMISSLARLLKRDDVKKKPHARTRLEKIKDILKDMEPGSMSEERKLLKKVKGIPSDADVARIKKSLPKYNSGGPVKVMGGIGKKIEDKIKTIDIDTAPKKIFKGLAGRLAKRGYGKARK